MNINDNHGNWYPILMKWWSLIYPMNINDNHGNWYPILMKVMVTDIQWILMITMVTDIQCILINSQNV
jgi:hypothetical protein